MKPSEYDGRSPEPPYPTLADDNAMLVANNQTLRAENRTLKAIVDKLPKTADAVPIVPGMRLYAPYNNGRTNTGFQLHNGQLTCLYFDDGFDRCVWSQYSTREAAEAAERNGEGCR